MRNQQQDVKEFIPNIGYGNILFSYSKEVIISILGKPIEDQIDQDVNILYYPNLTLFFHYGDDAYLSIHLKDIILSDIKFSLFTKENLIDFVKKYHLLKNIQYDFEHLNADDIEDSYYFKNLGLTIWFESNEISDICLHEIW